MQGFWNPSILSNLWDKSLLVLTAWSLFLTRTSWNFTNKLFTPLYKCSVSLIDLWLQIKFFFSLVFKSPCYTMKMANTFVARDFESPEKNFFISYPRVMKLIGYANNVPDMILAKFQFSMMIVSWLFYIMKIADLERFQPNFQK